MSFPRVAYFTGGLGMELEAPKFEKVLPNSDWKVFHTNQKFALGRHVAVLQRRRYGSLSEYNDIVVLDCICEGKLRMLQFGERALFVRDKNIFLGQCDKAGDFSGHVILLVPTYFGLSNFGGLSRI